MTKIAHLTDLHILEPRHRLRSGTERARLSYLSLGRALDFATRRAACARALALARSSEADHVVVTGDLTEDGTEAQFETLAELLDESDIEPERLTLVPGNHDIYSDPLAWRRALGGPLRPYARTSASDGIVDLGDVLIAPVSTLLRQHWTRSAGALERAEIDRLSGLAEQVGTAAKAILVAQHHPPYAHSLGPLQWIDGLVGHQLMAELLAKVPRLFVLHGHAHRAFDYALRGSPETRAFCGAAVVDSTSPLRIYEVGSDGIQSLQGAPSGGGRKAAKACV